MMGPNGKPERYVSVRYDITERKRADTELKTALDQLSSFFAVAPDMLCITDVNGVLLQTSRAVEDVLGMAPEEIVGTTLHKDVHPDDVPETKVAMRSLAIEGKPVRIINRHPDRSGGWRNIEWRAT
jgi:PAS domain S-box-containing protein